MRRCVVDMTGCCVYPHGKLTRTSNNAESVIEEQTKTESQEDDGGKWVDGSSIYVKRMLDADSN